jgi:hypothetical protein
VVVTCFEALLRDILEERVKKETERKDEFPAKILTGGSPE